MKQQLKRLVEMGLARVTPVIWSTARGPRLLVLMYHRVLPARHPDRAREQPGMYVSDTTFDMHLAILKQRFELVHLDDWLRGASRGESLPRLGCALTFDDGWRDNFDHAFPILRRHQAPATIFLVSTFTGTDQEFWPNKLGRLLASMPAERRLPEPLGALLAPVRERVRARGTWSVEDIDAATVLAKQLGESQIRTQIDQALAEYPAGEPVRAVLNPEELQVMSASGLVRFGSHTRTHFRLRGEIPAAVLEAEIVTSRDEIGASVGRSAELFCYPNGDTTPAARDIVGQHYIGAVTTRKGWYVPGADPFMIPRIGVHEDISNRPASFLARLSGFL